MNLYELTQQFQFLQDLLENPEVDQQMVEDTIADLELDIEEKADGYAKVIRNMEGIIAAIKQEQDRLASKKATLENSIKRLKTNLQEAMITTGKTKFKTELFSFSIQKNGGADPVIVDVETDELPDDLVTIVEKPNLKAIADYIKETGDLTYAHFGERGESLRIK